MDKTNKPVTPAEIAHLADITSTGKLLNYLFHDPTIQYMVDCESLELADVSTVFMNDDQNQVEIWLSNAEIIIHTVGSIVEGSFVDPTMAVHCIRVDPFYIYKHTGKKYE